jgi:putative ubiquitin-RnfH superfamily antitoxin RatB of RatAB toxin-antitoxin module
MFTVRTNAKDKMNVFVTNTVGQLVLATSSETATTAIDLSNQPTGIYYVKVTSGTQSSVKRLEVIR